MASINLKNLIQKLNDTCRRSLEAAAGLCLSRTNYNVEIEHWLAKLLETEDSDIKPILERFEINPSRFLADITAAIDRLKTGNAKPPALSQDVVDLARQAWILASVDMGGGEVRSGHLLIALLSNDSLERVALGISSMFEQISVESLKAGLLEITANSVEQKASNTSSAPTGNPSGSTTTASLDRFTIDLTERARSGGIDPVLGRDAEIRQIMDILCRRRQNNPILTGEAGVGKTAVAEGFALRIAAGDVPPSLKNVSLRSLDLGLLQAGAGVKGEFENRLKSVIEEVKGSPTPIILFIDEAHTMIGAGGQAGQGDAANLLKPALARGELRTIAATTWAEYKKYFERDAALARRFQVVKVEEPTEDVAIEMMRGLVATLENHHDVRIMNTAVEDAVRLSHRYISGRLLPDKSVSLIDTTCARIGLSQSATPPAVEDAQRKVESLRVAIGILEREIATGVDHSELLAAKQAELAKSESDLERVTEQWGKEKELVEQIHQLYAQISNPVDGQTPDTAELNTAEEALKELQGDLPLVHPYVDSGAVAETVESWTGIPVGKMVADEIDTILKLKDLMVENVVGQDLSLIHI